MEVDILSEVINDIEKHFYFLFERGFKIQSMKYYPQAFGDWDIVLGSSSCHIRIGAERGIVMLSFRPPIETAYFATSMEAMIYFLSNGEQYVGVYKGNILDREQQLERFAKLLEIYIDRIISLFSKDHERYTPSLLIAQQKVSDLLREELREEHKELIRKAEERSKALKESLKHQKPDS
jgi:hypothetical protein